MMIMSEPRSHPPTVALTFAGLDPSGGAGVIADIRTFAAFRCFPTAVVTSLTFQNTMGVFGIEHQSAESVRAQLMPLLEDFTIACAKTGMLPSRRIVAQVSRLFRETALPAPVVDPVMRSTGGQDLMDEDAVSCFLNDLFPLARVVTPNISEAERLTGLTINDESGMREAARLIRETGVRAVLVKGGHLPRQAAGGRRQAAGDRRQETQGFEVMDVLDDGGRVTVFRDEWIEGGEVHGSGCMLSAAIAACLGKGMDLEDSVSTARRFVAGAIRNAPSLGHGARPLWTSLATTLF
jgi:hydroxymethylpyrimidine/phosphomethylpyrimidine kinase